ncbi:S66 peptidase family protein [Bacillus daqingensis]|uniref:S66 peptidase family protein n=1 Tax=Bacillus daqingensis TaxID=872396 RepID=A0ABV9NWC7_9BACI
MILWPRFQQGDPIAVTAPSSGVPEELHHLLTDTKNRQEQRGFPVTIYPTAWKQKKSVSAPAEERAAEFNRIMKDESPKAIIPPWGGERLLEMLPLLDYSAPIPKWILGYSDTSALLFAWTIKTGIATAHGTNIVDIRGAEMDPVTAAWEKVLAWEGGKTITQSSSELYQPEWKFDEVSDVVFHLTEPTEWKTVSGKPERVEGRLLGGCIDVITHLVGTPYGKVREFQRNKLHDEPILWYFENCDMNPNEMKRCLKQMEYAGWFENSAGFLFGRSAAVSEADGYTAVDVYQDLAQDTGLPVIYDIDCGHVPPQLTFVNGAWAAAACSNGKGTLTMQVPEEADDAEA